MTDPGLFSTAADQKTDLLLKQVFHRPDELTGEFENRVMFAIYVQTRRSRKRQSVLVIMITYWIAACLTGSWLMFDSPFGAVQQSTLGLGVLLTILSMVGTGIYLLVRQSDFKLSDLFLGTIR